MSNYALLIEYDGTAYGGWQIQRNSSSIQGAIEKTLSMILQDRIKVTGAGRTDAGVHARGQVANFKSECGWTAERLMFALNGTLPEDIGILASAIVPDDFHARFSAVARRYSYNLVRQKMAIARKYSAFFPFEFSIDAMNSAARLLLGENDFRSFVKYADEQRHSICNVTRAEWKTDPGCHSRVSALRFEIQANRFLHGMVRAIVGTLLDVGRGKLTVEDFETVVRRRDRREASMSVPACGLFLEEVSYGFDLWDAGYGTP